MIKHGMTGRKRNTLMPEQCITTVQLNIFKELCYVCYVIFVMLCYVMFVMFSQNQNRI